MIRKTPIYSLEYFTDGSGYSARADHYRMQTIENQIDAAMKITNGGVIKGWEVSQTESGRNIVIKSGIGIIPIVMDAVNRITGEKLLDDNGDTIKEQHFLAIRTNSDLTISGIGRSRKSSVYMALDPKVVSKFLSNPNYIADVDSYAVVLVKPPVDGDASTDKFGAYRNVSPYEGQGDYPITQYSISGGFDSTQNRIVLFINGKPLYDGFSVDGNKITLAYPLSSSDAITARIDPLYSLLLAEVETDSSKVISIDNSVKTNIYEKSADSYVQKSLLNHKHTGDSDASEKILLTTRTGLISSSSSKYGKEFVFLKSKNNVSFSALYGFPFDTGTYDCEVYINGFFSTDPYVVLDTGNQISVTFSQPLESTDIVEIMLYVKENLTQISGKIQITDDNPSQERISVEVSGDRITSGTLNPISIPQLDHIGYNQKILRPCNSASTSEEYVHRTETFDYTEFFPVYSNLLNARNAKDMFFEDKASSGTTKGIVHLCGSGSSLFAETKSIVSNDIDKLFKGWSDIRGSMLSKGEYSNEYDAPYRMVPIKLLSSPSGNNWDSVFFVSEKYIVSVSWLNTSSSLSSKLEPVISEIVNSSLDRNPSLSVHSTTLTNLIPTKIIDAEPISGLLNLERTILILSELSGKQKCLAYEYSSNKYTWLDLSPDPVWNKNGETATSVTVLNKRDLVGIDCDVAFVGTKEGGLYFNSMGKSIVRNGILANSDSINNITFEPSTVWDSETHKFVESGSTVILSTLETSSETVNVSSTSYGIDGTVSIQTLNKIRGSYKGRDSQNNSAIIKEWVKIAENFDSPVIKVSTFFDKIFVLTEKSVYTLDDSDYSDKKNINYIASVLDGSMSDHNLLYTLSSGSFKDFELVGDSIILVGSFGIKRASYSNGSLSVQVSQNVDHCSSINNMLVDMSRIYKSATLCKNENTAFVCGKYGVFITTDAGNNWRNTTQIIGSPEDRLQPLNNTKCSLKIIDKDSVANRIYVQRTTNVFDGSVLRNPVEGLEIGDYIYSEEDTGSIYSNIPIRILSTGKVDGEDKYFIDIEQIDFYPVDFDQIFLHQNISVYGKIKPLILLNGTPQSNEYGVTDAIENDFDINRQSVIFDDKIDEDLIPSIASKYICFEPFDRSDTSLIVSPVVNVGGLTIPVSVSSGKVSINNGLNREDIVKLTVTGTHISNVGSTTHTQIEDVIVKEELGLEYGFDGVRTGNMLTLLSSIRGTLSGENGTNFVGTVSSVSSLSESDTDPYFDDTSASFLSSSLVGKMISFANQTNGYTYSISGNTSNRIYLSRIKSFEDISVQCNGTQQHLFFKKMNCRPMASTISVYKDGVPYYRWSSINDIYGISLGIDTEEAFSKGSKVIVSYINTFDNINPQDFISVGESYTIINSSSDILDNMYDVYNETFGDNSFVDIGRCFIENKIITGNDSIGEISHTSSSLFYNPEEGKEYLLVGSENGIWKMDNGSPFFNKTGPLLHTLDSTGSQQAPYKMNGGYIQFDKATKTWTVTWGGSSVAKDKNDNLSMANANCVVRIGLRRDKNVILIGADDGVYRSVDDGDNWECVWDTVSDSRVAQYPIVRSLVFDDKHKWVVNAVFDKYLFRSFDFGNNWENISGSEFDVESFSYQIDESDTRSAYYYGKHALRYKRYDEPSKINSNYIAGENQFENVDLLGLDFGYFDIKSIVNDKENPNIVYLSLGDMGVFKTTVLGRSRYFSLNDAFYEPYSNVISTENVWISENNARRTCAFYDLEDSINTGSNVGPYLIFVDKKNKLTYVQVNIDGTVKDVPADGEFVGKMMRIDGVDNSGKSYYKSFKIAENYDRGAMLQYVQDVNGNYLEIRRLEFVLNGEYFDYLQADNSNVDYYWYPPEFQNKFTSKISIFGESNGRSGRIKLEDLPKEHYVIKGDFWNSGNEETVVILNHENTSVDFFKDYYIGDRQSERQYKIINSRNFVSTDKYYLAYDVPRVICRLERITGDASDVILQGVDNPINLWFRYKYTDLHNTWKLILSDHSDPLSDDIDYVSAFGEVHLSNYFVSDSNQRVLLLRFAIGATIPDCSGRYIGSTISKNRYMVYDSHVLVSGEELYDASEQRVLLRLDLYSSAVNDNLSLYLNGLVASVSGDTLTMSNLGGIEQDSLVGARVFNSNRKNKKFVVTANSGNQITLLNVENIDIQKYIDTDDVIFIDESIESKESSCLIKDDSSINLYSACIDGIYSSKDYGKSWTKFSPVNHKTLPLGLSFDKIFQSGSYVYASSRQQYIGGLFVVASSGFTNEFKKIYDGPVNGSVFYSTSTNVIGYIVSDTGIYKGSCNSLSPETGTWTWTKISLPQNNVTAVKLLTNYDNKLDVDKIWIGTRGRGIFWNNKGESIWNRSIVNNSSGEEIASSLWRLWDSKDKNGVWNVSSLGVKVDESHYSRLISDDTFVPVLAKDITDTSKFDWKIVSSGTKHHPVFMYLLDPSNASFIDKNITPHIVDQASRPFHKFSNFMSTIIGFSKNDFNAYTRSTELYRSEFDVSSYGALSSSFYEEPFQHYPDKQSVTKIVEHSSGKLIIGTDRNGIWRSDGERFTLPIMQGSYDQAYGYDFVVSNFTSIDIIDTPGYYFFNGKGVNRDGSPLQYNYLSEKLYQFIIEESDDLYSDIPLQYEDLIGAYVVIAETMDKINGPSDYLLFEIKSISKTANSYVLVLTAGRMSLYNYDVASTDHNTDIIIDDSSIFGAPSLRSRWSKDGSVGFSSFTKFCIIDFEKYHPICENLPTVVNFKDQHGNPEYECFVKDLAITGDKCFAACGISGLYYAEDITSDTVSWETLIGYTITSSLVGKDITCVLPISDTEIWLGTWGEGIHKGTLSGSEWTFTSLTEYPNIHKQIWTLFKSSNGDVYAGTEHGGIYRWDHEANSWSREIDGVGRSKIHIWKTTGSKKSDYSDSDKMMSYSWGGGIMKTTTRGDSSSESWQQANNGLDNYYVQDVSICPSSGNIAYAATFGGGVYKTETAFGETVWEKCSTDGLPETLNITDVEVGSNPSIVYIKASVNDLSLKDVPFRYRNVAGSSMLNVEMPQSNYLGKWFESGDFRGQWDNYGWVSPNAPHNVIQYYNPITPYNGGYKKHVIYRSEDGGASWQKVYDKDPMIQRPYFASSVVLGMKMVPGQTDEIKFIGCFEMDLPNADSEKSVNFCTIKNGVLTSQYKMNEYGCLYGHRNNVNISLSIDPKDLQTIYAFIYPNEGVPIILKSVDNGSNWSYSVDWENRDGFDSGIEISTIDPSSLTVGIYSSQSISVSGIMKLDGSSHNMKWADIGKLLDNNNNMFATIDFKNTTDLDSFNYQFKYEMFINPNMGKARPFYGNGMLVVPDAVSKPSDQYLVGDCGYGDFWGSIGDSGTTFVLSTEYKKQLRANSDTYSLLKNISLVKIDLSALSSTSLLRQEDALIGCDISFSNSSALSNKIAIHRIFNGFAELFLIGEVTIGTGSGVTGTIRWQRPLYTCMGKSTYVSINGAKSWVKMPNDKLGDTSLSVVASAQIPQSLSGTSKRRIMSLIESGGERKLYTSDVVDNRYSDGHRDDLDWNEFTTDALLSNVMFGGMAFGSSSTKNYVFLSCEDRILKVDISNGTSSVLLGNVKVQYPIAVSESDASRMCFIANDYIYTTINGYDNNSITYIGDLFKGSHVKSVFINPDIEHKDEILISVDSGQSFINASMSSLGIVSSEKKNQIYFIGDNQFSTSPSKWIGSGITFDDNGIRNKYSSKIKQVSSGVMEALPTVSGTVESADIDMFFDDCKIICLAQDGEQHGNMEDYVGNIISFQILGENSAIFSTQVNKVREIDINHFELSIDRSSIEEFTLHNLDFENSFPTYRLGCLTDFVPTNFSGTVSSSRLSEEMDSNGLWYSSDFGQGWKQITSASDGAHKPGCISARITEKGAVIAAFKDNNGVNVKVNSSYLPSSNLYMVESDELGDIWIAGDSGITICDVDQNNVKSSTFSNYYRGPFTSLFNIGNGKFLFNDEDGKTFIMSRPTSDFQGYEKPNTTSLLLGHVTKTHKVNDSLLWLSTAENGIYAIYKNNVYHFDSTNSPLPTSNILDIHEDVNKKLWVCMGDYGLAMLTYVEQENSIDSIEWQLFDQSSGFYGSVKSIVEKNGLNYLSKGDVTSGVVPSVLLRWNNESDVYRKSLIVRSSSAVPPQIRGVDVSFAPIIGTIGSIESAQIKIDNVDTDVWKITASATSFTQVMNLDTNSLVGKTILVNARESAVSKTIVANESDIYYVTREAGESAITQKDKIFLITLAIEDSLVIYTGDGESVGFEISDTCIINGTLDVPNSYYYHLFIFSPSAGSSVCVDSQRVLISPARLYSNSAIQLMAVTSSGIFNYKNTSGSIFELVSDFGTGLESSSAFIDSSNSIWICANDKLIRYINNTQNIFDKSIMFFDNLSSVSGDNLTIRNVTELSGGLIAIATNLGLVIAETGSFGISFNSFVNNDQSASFRIGNSIKMDKWYSSDFLYGNIDEINIPNGSVWNKVLITVGNSIYQSTNSGMYWDITNYSVDFPIRDMISCYKDGSIYDYVIIGDGNIGSFGSVDLPTTNQVQENMPTTDIVSDALGIPSSPYLSESANSTILFLGLFNNDVTEKENEIAVLSLDRGEPFSSTTNFLSHVNGLSVQSIYSFSEVDGIIFAGGKDNIAYSADGTSWKIVGYNSKENKYTDIEYCYTCIHARKDTEEIKHSGGIVVYSTRTPLYSSSYGQFSSFIDSITNTSTIPVSLVSFRIGDSVPIYDVLQTLDIKKLGSEYLQSRTENSITISEKPAFSSYSFPYVDPTSFLGHRGCLYFVESSKSILVGSFDNSLVLFPFTSDNTLKTNKNAYFYAISGRRSYANTSLPIYWHKSENKYHPLTMALSKPKKIWSLYFTEDNDEMGFASMFDFGIINNKKEDRYKQSAIESSDRARMFKTLDGGGTWQYLPSGLNSIVSSYFSKSDVIHAAYMYGNIVGINNSTDYGRTWSESVMPIEVPVKQISEMGDKIIAGLLGFGIYELTANSNDNWIRFVSRYVTENGLNFGKWNVTCIDEDPSDRNRILVGTNGQGVIEGRLYGNDWSWSMDSSGLPQGNITALKILPVNSGVVLIGLDQGGMYRKDPDDGVYHLVGVESGLPNSNRTVKDIQVDTGITSVYGSFLFDKSSATKIMIIRSSFELSKEEPNSNIVYSVGDDIYNAEVIYVGEDDFSTSAYVDKYGNLRSGIPYFYKFYEVKTSSYEEIGTLNGYTISVDKLQITVSGNPFSSLNLSGRVITLNYGQDDSKSFEILSNTSNVLTLAEDKFGIINKGDARVFQKQRLNYRIDSSRIVRPVSMNPIFMVYDSNGYTSLDNGKNWA